MAQSNLRVTWKSGMRERGFSIGVCGSGGEEVRVSAPRFARAAELARIICAADRFRPTLQAAHSALYVEGCCIEAIEQVETLLATISEGLSGND